MLVSPAFAQSANSNCWSNPPTMINNTLSIDKDQSFSIGCIFPLSDYYPYTSLDCILEHTTIWYDGPKVCTTSNNSKTLSKKLST